MPSDQPRKGQLCTCDRLPEQHLTTDCVPDSERAITTAARAMFEADWGLRAPWDDVYPPMQEVYLKRARAAYDPIVREEHDRLRSQIEAIPTLARCGHSINQQRVLNADEYRVAVLALLGESTQEQANKEER